MFFVYIPTSQELCLFCIMLNLTNYVLYVCILFTLRSCIFIYIVKSLGFVSSLSVLLNLESLLAWIVFDQWYGNNPSACVLLSSAQMCECDYDRLADICLTTKSG